MTKTGEELIKLLEDSGVKVRRLRPKEERCWGETDIGGGAKLEIGSNWVAIHLPLADIRFVLNEILVLEDGCISIGEEDGFINIYTRNMTKEKNGRRQTVGEGDMR